VEVRIDISKFVKDISEKNALSCEHIFYYTAPPFQDERPNDEQIKRRKGYDRFVRAIGGSENLTIREGRCQKILSSSGDIEYHQKGVDSLMVFDMASFPIKFSDIKKIVMITSDTDFCPIVKEMGKLGVDVLLCTYREKKRGTKFSVSNHLIDCCSDIYYLTKEDFQNARLVKCSATQATDSTCRG